MRVEISYKFIMGFIIVVGSIVLVNVVVPYLGIPPDWQQLFIVTCAILVGLVLGWLFSKAFTANIRVLNEAAVNLSHGDLSRYVRLRSTALPDETADLAASLNRVINSLRELVGTIRASSLKVAESSQGLSATSEQMTATAHEVASTVEQISRGAERQAEMVEHSSQLIREMAVAIDQISAAAGEVAASASDTTITAQRGGADGGAAASCAASLRLACSGQPGVVSVMVRRTWSPSILPCSAGSGSSLHPVISSGAAHSSTWMWADSAQMRA